MRFAIWPLGLPIKAGQPQWPFYEDQTSGRNGRFINQERPNGEISRFGRLHIVPYKEFMSGQAEPFFNKGLAKQIAALSGVLSRPASNCRF